MLSRVRDLQKEIATLAMARSTSPAVTDITTHLNTLNVKLQVKDILLTDMHAHNTAFKVKELCDCGMR